MEKGRLLYVPALYRVATEGMDSGVFSNEEFMLGMEICTRVSVEDCRPAGQIRTDLGCRWMARGFQGDNLQRMICVV